MEGVQTSMGGSVMCTISSRQLTFESMLEDPLIRMVMNSDRVPTADFVAQMERARDTLVADQDRNISFEQLKDAPTLDV
jgi:hypothetical protein